MLYLQNKKNLLYSQRNIELNILMIYMLAIAGDSIPCGCNQITAADTYHKAIRQGIC